VPAHPEKEKFSKMPHARQKRKGQSAIKKHWEEAATKTQHCIRAIAGEVVKIEVCAFNKLLWWRTGNRSEIRYCSYT
jgi:hypothetical protein